MKTSNKENSTLFFFFFFENGQELFGGEEKHINVILRCRAALFIKQAQEAVRGKIAR